MANLPCDGIIVICKNNRWGCGCGWRCCGGGLWCYNSCTRAFYSSFIKHTDASGRAVSAIITALRTIRIASYAFATIRRGWITSTASTTTGTALIDTEYTVVAAVCPSGTALGDCTRWTAAVSIRAAPWGVIYKTLVGLLTSWVGKTHWHK
jgi:hypothetical protein